MPLKKTDNDKGFLRERLNPIYFCSFAGYFNMKIYAFLEELF